MSFPLASLLNFFSHFAAGRGFAYEGGANSNNTDKSVGLFLKYFCYSTCADLKDLACQAKNSNFFEFSQIFFVNKNHLRQSLFTYVHENGILCYEKLGLLKGSSSKCFPLSSSEAAEAEAEEGIQLCFTRYSLQSPYMKGNTQLHLTLLI
jgi:hypothetical protein